MSTQTGYLSGTTLGRFRIGSLLGRGGMGEVYRAEDAELGRSVALKVLPESLLADEERLARFTQEARTASALNHPHIVAIYDIGRPTAPQTLGVLPAGGGEPIAQFRNFAVATGAGSIVWDNDGRGILYTSVERANVWRQPLSGGAPQKVTAYADLTIFRFALSRDGRLALGRGTQTRDAVLITNFR